MGLYESLKIDESGIGEKYGSWTQIGPSFMLRTDDAAQTAKQQRKRRRRVAVCVCRCGACELPQLGNLKEEKSTSCRECSDKRLLQRITTHGRYRSRVYHIWQGMKQRCCNPKTTRWEDYGGRGIEVCQRWLDSFDNFVIDMGEPSTNGLTIERIDNNGNYDPGNCRWATRKEQMRNTRSNRTLEYRGEQMIVAEFCRITGMKHATATARLDKGMTGDQIAGTPLRNPATMALALIMSLVFCCTASAEPQATDYPYSAVARITAGNRGGSATLVGMSGTRGLVVTAAHVVGGSRSVNLTFPSGYKCEGRVLDSDRSIDIAVVECQVPAGMRTPRRVRAARESDGTLIAVGYPSYSRQTPCWTSGTFDGYAGSKVKVAMRRPIFKGYSGGMLIAPDGSYCGVTNWAARGETLAASGESMESFIGRFMPTGDK